MEIKKLAVIGSGQMGSGIAQVAAQSGLEVLLIDSSELSLKKAQANIPKSLEKLEEKKLISEAASKVFSRIEFSEKLDALKAFKADIVIEAIVENVEIKKKLFKDLAPFISESCILASNTSSISITTLAASSAHPHNFVGMHFMNPVPLMKLVELIAGLQTSPEVLSRVKALAEKMGKTCVTSKDIPGFIINRILMPMINEACYVLQEGIASVEDIDQGMKLGTNQPMGPLTLADFIGLDTCLSIMNVLFEGLGDSKYRASPLLKQYVAAGWLGKKSGRGFYKY